MVMITEDIEVKFKEYSELAYLDLGEPEVGLYVNTVYVGDIKVWKDSEEEGREYICINYEVVYLDTIHKFV
jgi:hypothetical protein